MSIKGMPCHYLNGMDDSEVVSVIVAGDPAGLAAAYDRYATPLYNFCTAMLREPADAADVVQDTFVIAAANVSRLRDPALLRPWLYAVARNECRRRLRRGRQWVPFEAAEDVADDTADVTVGQDKADVRAQVRDAIDGLGPADREVLELRLHHDLSSGEIAAVLGISPRHASALLSRAQEQLETSLSALVLARVARRDCAALDALLEGWDGRLTVLLRKRLNRHARACHVCSGRQRQEMVPSAFLGIAVAAALPYGFRHQVLRAALGASPASAAHGAASAAWTFGSGGFPVPLARPRTWWQTRLAHAGAATGTAAAVASAVAVVALPPHHVAGRPGGPAAVATPTAVATLTAVASIPAPRPGNSSGVTGSTAAVPSTPSAGGTTASAPSRTSAAASSASVSAVASPAPSVSPSAAAGTLSVTPLTVDLVPPASGTITVAASGGPVDWSVSEPPGLEKKVVISPMSGALAAGDSTTITVTMVGSGKPTVHLVFAPGGTEVVVDVQ
jgi:RNA polymerase sigma factor (sigma-70 family)